MKKTYKVFAFILSIVMICLLFGCSKAENDNEIIGGADDKTNIIMSDNESPNNLDTETRNEEKTTVGDLGKSISYVLTEDEAKEKAYAALKKEFENGRYSAMQVDMEAFEFNLIELKGSDEGSIAFNRGYGNTDETENFSGHAYYYVEYKVTTQLCDFAYLCIDAVNGDLLFSGYMGD